MIISRTPLRISFAGGGSDLPAYYRHAPGAVVSTSIDKYIYITINKKFDHQIRASYSVTEIVDTIEELHHELIREGLRMVGLEGGIEITSISDIPSQGTGLGSSSTYTVGLLKALYAYKGLHAGAERLGREACEIEINICGKPIGKQDQYIAAFGGLQFIQFNPDGSVFVDPIICSIETKRNLQNRLLMLYTGIQRSTNSILSEQSHNTEHDPDKRRTMDAIVQLAHDLRESLESNDLGTFGEILHEGWMRKKKMASSISNSCIDEWYETARRHGAVGGKILGAGAGGFLLLYAPTERHAEIVQALAHMRAVPIRFEQQGSKVIYVEENWWQS
jgi:D-glycero-alpha-D-manno-heptose-7-phosphate kinase